MGLSGVVRSGIGKDRFVQVFTTRCILLIFLFVGLLVRLWAFNQQLWLDEVWSVIDVMEATSFLAAITRLNDNNHILTSGYLYLISPQASSAVVRFPALLFGICAVSMLWCYRSVWPHRAVYCLALLMSVSYLINLYSTEARGYAGLLCAMVCAQFFAEASLKHPRKKWLLFGLLAAVWLGLLSHASFIFYVAALCFWVFTLLWKRGELTSSKYLAIACMAAVFSALLIYVGFYSKLPAGTGNLLSPIETILNTAALTQGLPPLSAANPAWGALSLLGALIGIFTIPFYLRVLWRAKDSRFLLCVILVVCYPLFVLFLLQPRVLFVRYFLISVVAYYWLLSLAYSHRRELKSASVLLLHLLVIIAGNLGFLGRFLVFDRGGGIAALEYISVTSSQIQTLGSDQDFRAETLLAYLRISQNRDNISYLRQGEFNIAPDWYLRHSVDLFSRPQQSLDFNGGHYLLEREFRHTAESGWTWWLYKRKENW